MNLTAVLVLMLPFLSTSFIQKSSTEHQLKATLHPTDWVVADFLKPNQEGVTISGSPKLIDCKYGKAVLFNGKDDGIFIDQMPLKGLTQFTVEILIRYDRGGQFEQRYFHCGEVTGDRILMEMRSKPEQWFLDAYVKSGPGDVTLANSDLLHPLDQWYHIAFVVQDGRQLTYVNGKKELEASIGVRPIMSGKTSIGVRQNKVAWFKGAIYKIRITPKILSPAEFMTE